MKIAPFHTCGLSVSKFWFPLMHLLHKNLVLDISLMEWTKLVSSLLSIWPQWSVAVINQKLSQTIQCPLISRKTFSYIKLPPDQPSRAQLQLFFSFLSVSYWAWDLKVHFSLIFVTNSTIYISFWNRTWERKNSS